MLAATRTAELGWGQRYIWLRHYQLPPHARHESHIVLTRALPHNPSMVKVRTMLNYIVRRHEALRTTYHFDTAGDPQQRVHPPAAVPVVIVTAERDGTPAPAEIIEQLSTAEFDLATEWPIRACVVTAAGLVKQLILVLNHMAFDAWSVDKFERELEALGAGIDGGRPAILTPIRQQPVDLARHESSPDAIAAKDRALAYWRDEIAELPTDPLAPRRRNDTEPTARSAALTSPAMLAAGRRIAQRHNVWPSLVHLSTYAMVMAAYSGSPGVTNLVFSGNRDRDAYTDVMTCMFSPMLMHVDCQGNPPFAEVLRRSARSFKSGQDSSYVPYDELVELVAHESFRRGEPLRLGSEVNFLGRGAVATRARRTKLIWSPAPAAWAQYRSDTYFRVNEMQDAIVVTLNALSTVMDAEAIEQFLRGYEAVLLAHDDPSVDLHIDDVARLVGFARPAAVPVVAAAADEPNAATGPAHRDLAAVVAQVNGLDALSLTDSYTVAGGRAVRIPRVLELLSDLGWCGVSLYELAGAAPLRTLACHLTPIPGKS